MIPKKPAPHLMRGGNRFSEKDHAQRATAAAALTINLNESKNWRTSCSTALDRVVPARICNTAAGANAACGAVSRYASATSIWSVGDAQTTMRLLRRTSGSHQPPQTPAALLPALAQEGLGETGRRTVAAEKTVVLRFPRARQPGTLAKRTAHK